jgi:hypothetical protein
MDWPSIIQELRMRLTESDLSLRMGVPRSTLYGWHQRGIEPKHHHGERLIYLWCRFTQRPRQECPRLRNPTVH